jgi:septal ring factor EnvC (AmiA/AmiB activator)
MQLIGRSRSRIRAGAGAASRRPTQALRGCRAAAWHWRVAAGAMLWASIIIGVVAGGLVPWSEALAAASAPGNSPESLEAERWPDPRGGRERLRATQRAPGEEVRALTAAIETLDRQRAQVSGALRALLQRALALEQRLDYLVPRLLAREADVRERRARAAQALAELAARSRRVPLDSTERARLLALSPLMVERLRTVESNLGSVRRPEQTIERHAQIARSLDGLMAARQRLSGALAEKRRQRQVALQRLGEPDADLPVLADQQARMVAGLLSAASGAGALSEPWIDRPPRLDLAGIGEARAAGAATADGGPERWRRPIPGAEAERRSAAQLQAAAPPAADMIGQASPAGEAGWPAIPAAARPLAAAPRGERPTIWPGASHDALSPAKPLDLAFEAPRRVPATAASRGDTPLLLPVAQPARGRGMARHDHLEITIPARPGQGVVAPVDGRVVFADRFKSYGLLLIIEHEREYHTLLWGFAWLDVRLGDYVLAGQVLGIMGARGDDPPVLHVERRRHGRPIELAASSSGIQG